MRAYRLRLGAIAAWLGMIALGFNALVPIQLAFGLAIDLAHARECGHHEGAPAARHSPGWWVLALLTGHDETADPSHSHKGLHPTVGAVCAAIGTPAGFTPPAVAALPLPASLAEAAVSVVVAENQLPATPSAYRSRAPPSRTADLTR
jgi:hypothetical protein